MANLSCQLAWVWSQLRDKLSGTPLRHSLDQVIWSLKTHPKLEQHLLGRRQEQRWDGICVSSSLSGLYFSTSTGIYKVVGYSFSRSYSESLTTLTNMISSFKNPTSKFWPQKAHTIIRYITSVGQHSKGLASWLYKFWQAVFPITGLTRYQGNNSFIFVTAACFFLLGRGTGLPHPAQPSCCEPQSQ